MIDDFGPAPPIPPTQWSHNETIDADEVRMFVNQQVQAIKEFMGRDFAVYYLREMSPKAYDKQRLKGISPQDCKILAHDIVDFLIKDEDHPLSVRKQCVEDSVAQFQYTVASSKQLFIGDDGNLKIGEFVDHFIKSCEENLYIFNCIEGRIQHHTSSKKLRM